jgi:anhydro-N-acetylmuramic acid kinase
MTRLFIGLSSGASLSGVDAALVHADGVGHGLALKLEQFLNVPYSAELGELLRRVVTNASPEMRHVAVVHRVLGETYALAVKQLLAQGRVAAQDVFGLGCSGQSLWHDPDGRYPATLQLGMAGVVAERTGITTLSDFASRDIALGGQGQPLTAMVDALLFQDAREHRVLIDLASVASVVSLPGQLGPSGHRLLGYQAAPCTLLLDGLMRLLTNGREHCDAGGKHAVQGRCLEPLLERWLHNHFFQKRPPKSVPRQEFGPDFLSRAIEQAKRLDGNLHDVLCTMTHFLAAAIVQSMHHDLPALPDRILLSGRGVRNGLLWHLLEQKLAPIPLQRTDSYGVPIDTRKAVGIAGITALTMDGVVVNLPGVTGASGSRLLGQFAPGTDRNWARCLTWMARHVAPVQAAAA